MNRVFVCEGMSWARNEKINEQAKLLGKILALNKSTVYVQGGSEQGLMGATLHEFLKYSKNVEFLIPDVYYEFDEPVLRKLVGNDIRISKSVGEAGRLNDIKKCSHIIVMPGGTGTLEELLYCNETFRSKEHNNRITLVNIDGFYDGFLSQIKRNIEEGLTKPDVLNFEIVKNVEEIDFERSERFEKENEDC